MTSSRPPFLQLLSALVIVGGLLGACGDDAATNDAAAQSDAAAGEWVYVDGSGRETRLDEVPERIVAHASAAAALLSFGIRPVAIYADSPVGDDLALNHVDLDGIEIVGEEWGVINVEAVAAADPDLIVAEWWPVEEAYSGLEEGTQAGSQALLERLSTAIEAADEALVS